MPPKFNHSRAIFVLNKIDEILAWEQRKEMERDTKFVELGRYLCEVRAGQYWRVENLKSFDDFLERRFPGSRRKAYYLMSIHENLPPQARKELKKVGWAKGLELAKLARRDRQNFDCATWLHKARDLSKEDFQRAVERELTGKITKPWEIVYFKLYQSQIPVIDRALETAALMLGSDGSKGHRLEMICADFLAGANLDYGDPGNTTGRVSPLEIRLPLRSVPGRTSVASWRPTLVRQKPPSSVASAESDRVEEPGPEELHTAKPPRS